MYSVCHCSEPEAKKLQTSQHDWHTHCSSFKIVPVDACKLLARNAETIIRP